MLFSAIAGGAIKDGVILGVSVITVGEAKGHGVYIDKKSLETFLSAATNRQGGVPVKMDHGTGFYHIVGKLENFRIDGESLRADLHLLKSHEQYARICEMAETMADSFGLSVSSVATSEKVDGKEYLRCEELNSVDLVDRPAANPTGLFSEPVDSPTKGNMADANTLLSRIKSVFVETENADLATATKANAELSEKITKFEADLKAAGEKVTKLEADLAAKVKELSEVPAKIEAEASKKAQTIMASLGQPPVTSTPAVTPAATTQDTSKMSPRERVIAHFKAQSAAKANATLTAK